jgi:hypothetical protein
VIQILSFHSSTIQDDMVDTPKSHKYSSVFEYLTCLHHIILDLCFPLRSLTFTQGQAKGEVWGGMLTVIKYLFSTINFG